MNWTPHVRNLILGAGALLLIVLAPAMVVASEPAPMPPAMNGAIEEERAIPLGDVDADPLGLLWDENGVPFDEEIIIKDGLIYT